MSRLILKSITSSDTGNMWNSSDIKAVINVAVPLSSSTTLDQDMTIERIDAKWVATIELDGFPPQESPEEAADKLGAWLGAMAKAVKGRNIKHLKIADLFKAKHV